MGEKKGFTLLELLIVIAIIAVLAGFVLVVINPGEMMKRARDAQRVSDLASIRSAISLYVTDVTNASICGNVADPSTHIWYSNSGNACPSGYTCTHPTSSASSTLVNGDGWIPIDFTQIAGGSPISILPVDPTNDSTYYYTYACDSANLTYETDAKLESAAYSSKMSHDGGNASNLYEIGTDPGLDLLPPPTPNFYQ